MTKEFILLNQITELMQNKWRVMLRHSQGGDVKWDVIAGTFSVICSISASLDASASASDSEELFVRIIFALTRLE